MNALRLAGFELRRFRTPLQRLALTFLVLLPLLYGALYLWSNWDPYGKLDQIPVAVVNQDQTVSVPDPADPAGKARLTIDAGRQLADALRADRIFDWRFTGAADAEAGLRDGRYYATLTIPSSFSADLASGSTASPQKARLDMRRDDGNGYVVGIMVKSAKSELEKRVDQAATTAYFESVYGSLAALHGGLVDAQHGAVKLRDGLAQGKQGTTQLVAGLTKLDSGAQQLASGSEQVADGTQRIADVVDPLVETVLPALPRIADDAVAVTSATSGLTAAVATGADGLPADAIAMRQALIALGEANPALKDDPTYQEALAAANRAVDRAKEVQDKADEVASAAKRLDQDSHALQRDVPAIQKRLRAGAADIDRLATGARQVADGAQRLKAGIGTARSGAQRLDHGMTQLHDGAAKLSGGLGTAVDRLPSPDPAQRKRDAQVLGSPADVHLAADHDARVYGRGLAPFFFSIALWVFGVAAFLILRPLTGRALAGHVRSSVVAIGGWLPVFAVGGTGGLVLLAVCWAGLRLDPVHAAATTGLVLLGAACFTAMAHLFRTALNLVGSALTLVLLMFQLTSSGGIYPVETLPEPFRLLHPVLPMSYLVDGFRITMTGGNGSHLAVDALVLCGFLAVTLMITVVVVHRRRTWTVARLHPTLG